MSQQTTHPGGTAVAEPPAPLLPGGSDADGGGDNRRKLMIVGAAVGVLVLAIAAFFLLKGGGSSSSDNGLVPTHHTPAGGSAAAPQSHPVTLPKHVTTPVGRNPFHPLYVVPVAAPSAPAAGTGTTPTTSNPTGTTTGTTTAATFHPVWIMLKSVSASAATFDVGYSNGKTLRAVAYSVKAPKSGAETAFAKTFALLGINKGTVLVKFGDGTPFRLDTTHNYMVVD